MKYMYSTFFIVITANTQVSKCNRIGCNNVVTGKTRIHYHNYHDIHYYTKCTITEYIFKIHIYILNDAMIL